MWPTAIVNFNTHIDTYTQPTQQQQQQQKYNNMFAATRSAFAIGSRRINNFAWVLTKQAMNKAHLNVWNLFYFNKSDLYIYFYDLWQRSDANHVDVVSNLSERLEAISIYFSTHLPCGL